SRESNGRRTVRGQWPSAGLAVYRLSPPSPRRPPQGATHVDDNRRTIGRVPHGRRAARATGTPRDRRATVGFTRWPARRTAGSRAAEISERAKLSRDQRSDRPLGQQRRLLAARGDKETQRVDGGRKRNGQE